MKKRTTVYLEEGMIYALKEKALQETKIEGRTISVNDIIVRLIEAFLPAKKETKRFLIQGEYCRDFGWIIFDSEIQEAEGDQAYWDLRFQQEGLFSYETKEEARKAQAENRKEYKKWEVNN